MPDTTRVWIYQCDRNFTEDEAEHLTALCRAFAEKWTAHNVKLRSAAGVFYRRFICLFADESAAGASGCSIDTSVRFIREQEQRLNVSMTNRMLMAYAEGDTIETVHLNDLPEKLKSGVIRPDTPVFDNLIATLGDMKKKWPAPFSETWFTKFSGE